MSSKVAIVADEIRKHLSAGDPTRPWGHTKPDFRLKRFGESASRFGAVSHCASGSDGGQSFGIGFKH